MSDEISEKELPKASGYGPAGGSLPGQQRALKHGLNPLKRAVNTLGNRLLDKRTRASKALVQWRADLIRDLGDDISTQQDAIVTLAVKTKLILDSIDVWLLQQDTLIIKRKKTIIPAVIQRQQLADALSRYMAQLGLQRRHKVQTVNDLLSQRGDENAVHGAGDGQGNGEGK